MTPKELAAYVRIKTNTNSVTFPDASIIALLAPHMDDMALEILGLDEDYFGDPETRSLAADKREYPFNSDILGKIKFVEAKLDGTNWIRLLPFDLRVYKRTTDEDTIVANFSNLEGEAYYDIFRRSLWLYSGTVATVSGGLKVWTFSYPVHITSLTSEIDISVDPTTLTRGFPRPLHRVLADYVVIDYKESKTKPIPLTQSELSIEVRKQKALTMMRGQSMEEEIIADLPPVNERWNNGQDL
jgi:hypothetical protein